jgi:subtilisin-like proprotein convertase family protein
VSDLAAADVGTLQHWDLTLGLEGGQTQWVTEPGIHIPDNSPAGIVSKLEVDGRGLRRQITVAVDLTHTHRGDLKLMLEAPTGHSVLLKSVDRSAISNVVMRSQIRQDSKSSLQKRSTVSGVWMSAITCQPMSASSTFGVCN